MATNKGKSDRTFLFATLLLLAAGFFVFSSASLGLVAREGASFSSVFFKQLGIAIFGIVVMIVVSNIDYKKYKRYSPLIFIFSVILTILVFIPPFGFSHGGAARWISLGNFTFQPSELLKIASVILLAALFSKYKDKISLPIKALIPFFIIVGIIAAIMLKQPDTGTFMVIFFALTAIYISSGAKILHILTVAILCVLAIASLAYYRPYVRARITTFINPSADAQGSGYQIQQALIAVGSGGVTGRGFGQSIQKFNFLPEPIGDSIFAVAAEEFGLVGGILLILLFVFFGLRGLKIAINCKDQFGRLLAVGIIMLIVSQAVINIAAIIGVAPLTGIPLSFISHGGTALMFTLAEVGIILNISKRPVRQKE